MDKRLRELCEEQAQSWMVPLQLIYGANTKLKGCQNFLTDTLESFAKEYAESECTRLASRVERLENALRRCKYNDCDKAHCFKKEPCQSCEWFNRALTGAHAEEKEK